MTSLGILLLALAVMLAVSFVIESLRKPPLEPWRKGWLPEGARESYITVEGLRLRRVIAGAGPPLVLMHTLRTQLELFHEVIPVLARDFEVHAFDFPGHGLSEIPPSPYEPELFARVARGYLRASGLKDATLVGESIGGAIALLLAAEANPQVSRVVAINSYDYDRGRGIHRGSIMARMLFTLTRVPVLAELVWRMRWPGIFAQVIRGSVHAPERLDSSLVRYFHDIGNRPGHYRAFISLIRNFPKWETLRRRYTDIRQPVLLVYGRHDWSRPDERDAAQRLIPGSRMITVEGAGHLMSFDKPEAVIDAVRQATGTRDD
jgi:pimeloyl-ACP methyl ester carboxylesterase